MLLRQVVVHDTRCQEEAGLQGGDGGEGGTAATLGLILDGADGPGADPAELPGAGLLAGQLGEHVRVEAVQEHSVVVVGGDAVEVLVGPLRLRQVHVLVDLLGPGLLAGFVPGVVLEHLLVVGEKDVPPGDHLRGLGVVLPELAGEGQEGILLGASQNGGHEAYSNQ